MPGSTMKHFNFNQFRGQSKPGNHRFESRPAKRLTFVADLIHALGLGRRVFGSNPGQRTKQRKKKKKTEKNKINKNVQKTFITSLLVPLRSWPKIKPLFKSGH